MFVTIFSGNLVESFKDFGSVYIYRFLPFFIALCIINNRQIEFNNDIIIFSAFIASSVAIYQGIFLDIKRVIGLSNHPMVFAGLLCIVIPMSFINFFNENFSLFCFLTPFIFDNLACFWNYLFALFIFIFL